jgi:hypothetical protein
LGLPTFSNAFRVSSAFNAFSMVCKPSAVKYLFKWRLQYQKGTIYDAITLEIAPRMAARSFFETGTFGGPLESEIA